VSQDDLPLTNDQGVQLLEKLDGIPQAVFSSTSQAKFDPGQPHPAKEWFADALGLAASDVRVKFTTSGRLKHAVGETRPAAVGVILLEGDLTKRFLPICQLNVGTGKTFGHALIFARIDEEWRQTAAVGREDDPVGTAIKTLFPAIPFHSAGAAPGLGGKKPGFAVEVAAGLNTILYGPPGTGKTYSTVEKALAVCGIEVQDRAQALTEYRRLSESGRIRFVTFHQSFAYEDFVEGIRPVLDDQTGQLLYEPRDGVFKEIAARAASRKTGASPAPDFEGRQFWKMSLGNTRRDEADVYSGCLEEGVVKLGWASGVDFSECGTREQVFARLKEAEPGVISSDYRISAVNMLKNKMSVGDIVIVSDGKYRFRAIAEVVGAYEYQPEDWGHRRPVKWLASFEPSLPSEQLFRKEIIPQTLYQLRDDNLKLDQLSQLLDEDSGTEAESCVLVIDEINRANISKVFGELITLLEPDKRLGATDEKRVVLPYSREVFGVPPNLFLIGTMNTADRSIASLDIALRRRFEFVEMMPDAAVLEAVPGEVEGVPVADLLRTINRRLEFLLDRDHTVGHSYFIGCESLGDLADVLKTRIIPLLQEYFHGDLSKVAWILGCGFDEEGACSNPSPLIKAQSLSASEVMGIDSEFDDRIRAFVNPAFESATGAAVAEFVKGIMS